jgi:hypothetical protein
MPPIAQSPEMTKTQASGISQSAAQYVLGCIGLASLTFACFSLGLTLQRRGSSI